MRLYNRRHPYLAGESGTCIAARGITGFRRTVCQLPEDHESHSVETLLDDPSRAKQDELMAAYRRMQTPEIRARQERKLMDLQTRFIELLAQERREGYGDTTYPGRSSG